VLLRKCDATFAANVPGFAKDSASMEWDRLVAREAGSDLLELSKNLVRAYVRKMGDAKVDATTVWDHPNMSHDINQRFESIIRNDKVDAARGVDNATKFGECLAKTRFRVENHELPRSALSCVNLCQRYLSPYEQARAGQQQASVTTVAAVTPPATTSKSTKTSKVAKAASNPVDTTASMVAAVQAAVAEALKSQNNNSNRKATGADNRRAPPPPTNYSASSPLPDALLDRPLGKSTSSRRQCDPPPNGLGLPADSGLSEWDPGSWSRARARFWQISRYAGHPALRAALTRCRPSDATMTAPRLDDLDRDVKEWTDANGCAYCAFRPRAPSGTPEADLWKYGTGDGAHNPVVCQPYIRFLCEGGSGECGNDPEVHRRLRTMVVLRPAQ
jgi:hypothetical protein